MLSKESFNHPSLPFSYKRHFLFFFLKWQTIASDWPTNEKMRFTQAAVSSLLLFWVYALHVFISRWSGVAISRSWALHAYLFGISAQQIWCIQVAARDWVNCAPYTGYMQSDRMEHMMRDGRESLQRWWWESFQPYKWLAGSALQQRGGFDRQRDGFVYPLFLWVTQDDAVIGSWLDFTFYHQQSSV